jgi:hypothetical protein
MAEYNEHNPFVPLYAAYQDILDIFTHVSFFSASVHKYISRIVEIHLHLYGLPSQAQFFVDQQSIIIQGILPRCLRKSGAHGQLSTLALSDHPVGVFRRSFPVPLNNDSEVRGKLYYLSFQ